MKNSRKFFILTTMLLLSFSASSAQEGPWKVILCSGDTLAATRLDSLHDSILSATWDSAAFSLPVDSIVALVQHKKGHASDGAVLGVVLGAVAGARIGNDIEPMHIFTSDPGGGPVGMLLGGVCGGVVGAVIGGLSSGSETYDLKGKSLVEKLEVIENLIAE